MGMAYFLVVFTILASTSLNLGIKDMCATTDHGMKTVRILSEGEEHCVFQLPNDKGILKAGRGQYCFNIDAVRRECAQYDAGLLQLRSKQLVNHVRVQLEEITPKFIENGASYLLGVKELHYRYDQPGLPVKTRIVTFLFDSGYGLSQPERMHRAFGTKTWVIKNVSEDAIAYLSIPCMGSNTSSMPAIYSYSPFHLQTYPIFILCHQILTNQSQNVTVACTRETIAAGTAILAVINDTTHCLFRPQNESDAVTKSSDADPDCPGCYQVNMTVARAACTNHSAMLLQVFTEKMFDMFVQESRRMFKGTRGTIFLPLGLRHQVSKPSEFHVDSPSYNITWDNGIIEDAKSLFENAIDTGATEGIAFYEPQSGVLQVLNPADVNGPAAVVCHQDPQYPVTGPPATQSSVTGPPGPHTTGPPGPHTTGPPGPHTTVPPGPHTTGPPGPPPTRPPGPKTTGPPAIKGTSTTSAASTNKPINILIMTIVIALATVASTKTSLVGTFRVRVTAT